MSSDPIADALNIAPLVDEKPLEGELMPAVKNNKTEEDFETARKNIQEIITRGQQALADMSSVALQSQSARGYEVLANLINTMVQANKDLLEIHAQKQELDAEDGTVGSADGLGLTTNELLRLIKNGNKKD